jgi:predicted glycoside hydrolase/deacetylase ChbG (UPF0249 family)
VEASSRPKHVDPRADLGLLIVNADDLGINRGATDAIVECYRQSRITSATAMVYMEDSRRAAEIAGSEALPVGLHLNFSSPFTATDVPLVARDRQARLVSLFTRWQLLRWVYIPGIQGLVSACVDDQRRAFVELYGHEPTHCDGHHFLHLAPNVVLADAFRTIPKIRKSLTILKGEKSSLNRALRSFQNDFIERRHLTVDQVRQFPSIAPAGAGSIPHDARVEVVVHPEVAEEQKVLLSDEWSACLTSHRLGSYRDIE